MLTLTQCPTAVTTRNVGAFHLELLSKFETGEKIEIELASVEEADLSLLQLLTALRNAAAEAGRDVRLRTPAPALVAALLKRAGFLSAPTAADLDFWFHGERPQ